MVDTMRAQILSETYFALEIILTAPLWPTRESLTATGMALHDAIASGAKDYARSVASSRFAEALQILAGWSKLIGSAIDSVCVSDHEPTQKLLGVYKHYADAFADWSKIQPAPGNKAIGSWPVQK